MTEEHPITPHAGPTLDGEGQLSYVGDDGRRYVMGQPPDSDDAGSDRLMDGLRSGSMLFHQIEGLCRQWLAMVQTPELDQRAALVLLLTTLETTLEQAHPESF